MAFDTFKNLSRKYDYKGDALTDNINCGSLQRIADATELMAKNYLQLQAEVEKYHRWYLNEKGLREEAERKITALKGVITRLKNKQP